MVYSRSPRLFCILYSNITPFFVDLDEILTMGELNEANMNKETKRRLHLSPASTLVLYRINTTNAEDVKRKSQAWTISPRRFETHLCHLRSPSQGRDIRTHATPKVNVKDTNTEILKPPGSESVL